MGGYEEIQSGTGAPTIRARRRILTWAGTVFRPGGWAEWLGVLTVFLTLEVSVLTIEQAGWITPQPRLTLILVMSTLAAYMLAKSRLAIVPQYLLAVILGIAVTVWQTSRLLPPETSSYGHQLVRWWLSISTTQPSESTRHFATFIVLFTWLMGFVSVRSVLRSQNPWVAVCLSGAAILINLSSLPADYERFFLFYLLSALLLIGQTRLVRRYRFLNGIDLTKRSLIPFVVALLCLSLLVVSLSLQIPPINIDAFENWVSGKMAWRDNIEGHWLNLFAGLSRKQPLFLSREQKEVYFSDYFRHGESVQFVVVSDEPFYWRTLVYDIYTSVGWKSSPSRRIVSEKESSHPGSENSSTQRQVSYRVIPKIGTDILLTAREYLSCDIPIILESLAPRVFEVNPENPQADASLPEDVLFFAQSLRRARVEGEISGLDDISRLLPAELELVSVEGLTPDSNTGSFPEGRLPDIIRVARRQRPSGDITLITLPYPLEPEQGYTMTINLSVTQDSDLSRAGTDYPKAITDFYLQLPPDITDRVRQLAESITAGADNAYDKAIAIRQYLYRIHYSEENVVSPPPDVDGVDHFLFTSRTGNCNYFASAMAVMLRSLDIPTRLCTGYLPGKMDAESGSFTLRSKQYHAWPEVYFPGYGWIEFEATPGAARGSVLEEEWGWWLNADNADSNRGDLNEETAPVDDANQKADALKGNGDNSPQTETLSDISKEKTPFVPFTVIATVFVILSAVILASAFYGWLWHLNERDFPTSVYSKMYWLTSRLRLKARAGQTPREYGSWLSSLFSQKAEAIDTIIETYQMSQYGEKKKLEPEEEGKLERAWRALQGTFIKRFFHLG